MGCTTACMVWNCSISGTLFPRMSFRSSAYTVNASLGLRTPNAVMYHVETQELWKMNRKTTQVCGIWNEL
jgi:hypothetical protein